ncbi:MAG: hypothetical protein KJ896_01515 [Nanoarchaeota archaeon]|nr:hypothetical protein [Nanoarchaeota archaeon]
MKFIQKVEGIDNPPVQRCETLEGIVDFPIGHQISVDSYDKSLRRGVYEITSKYDKLAVLGGEHESIFERSYNLKYAGGSK